MYLKFDRDEINWIDPKYLTKEVAQDIAGFWLDANISAICCARYNEDKTISHYWFNEDTCKWLILTK